MSMTKKHFEALAEALKATRPMADAASESEYQDRLIQWRQDRASIIGVCRRENPAFNPDRFMEWTER